MVHDGAVRLHVMGERGANREAATPDDIIRMADIAAEAMEASAASVAAAVNGTAWVQARKRSVRDIQNLLG